MLNHRSSLLSLVVVIAAALITPPNASAQSATTSASTPKQVRKKERKEARAARTADLRKLEKNGYKPGQDQVNYPQDLQNAEHKANSSSPAGASAP